MAYTGNLLKKVYPILEKMGEGVYFETMHDALNFQAETNEQARVIRSFFPGCKWERSYNEVMKWWTWDTTWSGIKIHIYALSETPKDCKAIVEKRTVKKLIATAYEEKEVEEEVIVGWDCGQDKKARENDSN